MTRPFIAPAVLLLALVLAAGYSNESRADRGPSAPALVGTAAGAVPAGQSQPPSSRSRARSWSRTVWTSTSPNPR